MLMAAVKPAQLSQGAACGRLGSCPIREAIVFMNADPSEFLAIQNTLNGGSASRSLPASASQAARPARAEAQLNLASAAQTLPDSETGRRLTNPGPGMDALR